MSKNAKDQLIDEFLRTVEDCTAGLEAIGEEIAKTRELLQLWESPSYLAQLIVEFLARHPAVIVTLLYAQIAIAGVVYTWSLYLQFGLSIGVFASASDFLLAALREPFPLGIALAAVTLQALAMVYVSVKERRLGEATLRLSRMAGRTVSTHTSAIAASVEKLREEFGESKPNAIKALEDEVDMITRKVQAMEEDTTDLEKYTKRQERRLRKWWIAVITVGVVVTLVAPYALGFHRATLIKQGVTGDVIVEYANRGEEASPSSLRTELSVVGTSDKFAFFYDRAGCRVHIIPIQNIAGIYCVRADQGDPLAHPSPDANATGIGTPTAR